MRTIKHIVVSLLIPAIAVTLVLAAPPGAFAGMQSDSYAINTDVISGGGGVMTSGSYQLQSTIGQPSPLLDQIDPPFSTTYDLYPGFWYTISAISPDCTDLSTFAAAFGTLDGDADYNLSCDLDTDGDVDGRDLSDFIAGL